MKVLTVFFAIFVVCGALGLQESEGEAFIQGTWHVAGEHKEEGGAARAWYLEWTFDQSSFKQQGYPPINQNGKYKIVEEDDSRLKLRLYDQSGTFGTKDSYIEIEIHRNPDKLTIDSMADYRRLEKKN